MPVKRVLSDVLVPALAAVGLEEAPRFQVVQMTDLLERQSPELNVDTPSLLLGLGAEQATTAQRVLLNAYPPAHSVSLVRIRGGSGERVWEGALDQLAEGVVAHGGLDGTAAYALFLPALPYPGSVTALEGVMAALLSPNGCPWDREQTHLSLRTYLLEETYEVLDALDQEDMAKLSEELGDLLLQIVFHAQIAVRDGEFRLAEVVHHIVSKLIRRHPHVFGEVTVHDADEVTRNWERLKAQERARAGQAATNPFAGISLAFPALSRAQELQRRGERFGFKWPDRASAWAKFEEEMREWQAAATPAEAQWELGDVLATLANVARWDGLDAESALREANNRFTQRLTQLLAQCEAEGVNLVDLPMEDALVRWRATA
ncbi:MAG: nucleoside triphosphate pyrophosphohydrolase [Anaerolineae bacterium]|nr:nucleoside triphosphate pyrophosphohydrolase [Anaerolineae bacterium]